MSFDPENPARLGISRRAFCAGLYSLAFSTLAPSFFSGAWAKAVQARKDARIAFLDHDEAVAEGVRRDIGRVEVLSPMPDRSVTAAGYARFEFKYIVGKTPIRPGGFVWFAMRHVFQASPPQASDPSGPGFVTVKSTSNAVLEVVNWPVRPDNEDVFLRAFPWQHPVEIRVKEGNLEPGDEVTLVYGEQAGGGPGARMQATQEPGFAFRVFVAPSPQDPLLPMAEDLVFPIVGGPTERLSLIAPSAVEPGKTMRLLLRAEDRYGNQSRSYSGTVVISGNDGQAIAEIEVSEDQQGVASIEVPMNRQSGVVRFGATDGVLSARSNPARIGGKPVYFGDIHGHTVESDGRGTPDQFYDYARNIAVLDFCALTDHDFMITDAAWKEIQDATERANEPGRFVTIHAYEWSGMTEVGGDHNVYFRGTETLLTRCRSYYDYRNQQAYHGTEPQTNHVEDLYSLLLSRFAEGEVMTIPHFGGRPANPRWHDPRIERMIEIFSDHRRSHEWAYDFLRKGYRIGIMASSDNHTGRPGYGFLHNPLLPNLSVEIGTGLIAVPADNLTREAVFDAIFQRKAYATSGDRILLESHMGNAGMGEAFNAPEASPLRVVAEGTSMITAIEIWKDAAVVQSLPQESESVDLQWIDPAPPEAGRTVSYWVRVLQDNGEEAISSPFWWTRSA